MDPVVSKLHTDPASSNAAGFGASGSGARFRSKSSRAQTLRIASTPTRFMTENMPSSAYLAMPEVSSERRLYMPIGFLVDHLSAAT